MRCRRSRMPSVRACHEAPSAEHDREVDARRWAMVTWRAALPRARPGEEPGARSVKVNLLVAVARPSTSTRWTCTAPRRAAHYIAQAATETRHGRAHLKADLGRVLLKLEQLQDETIPRRLTVEPGMPQMDEARARRRRWTLLKRPSLLERILADYAACGLVGEETNKLVGYLAAVSRKLSRPLAVVIQSSSAAGKSSLMDAVLAFMPEEERSSTAP